MNLKQAMLQADAHIIATIRSKQDYVLTDKNGKMVPEKVGMKGVQRDGMDYEFTVVMELDIRINAISTKDRTGLFDLSYDQSLMPTLICSFVISFYVTLRWNKENHSGFFLRIY